MWLAEIKEEGKDLYETFEVDNLTFYKLKEDSKLNTKKKRRYSDILKDPINAQKNIHRKLNMIKKFREKNGDIPKLIERWKALIDECIVALKKEYEIQPSDIFNLFDLTKYGFDLEEYE
ncbi:hypothetical protein NGRA_0134 [Nosema granulosis]|uniref:Uncharacterized protein n=1 Tax=Nosema granulosis TaxID=83296 RepID=A0A9P6H0W6_9MICR|nr:hypothetical protein NGRA_0134 [Nosema granulosis]